MKKSTAVIWPILFSSLIFDVSIAEKQNPVSIDERAIKLIIATPESDTWALDDEHSHLDVIVENVGTTTINIYDSWNSWGWDNLKLEWSANGKSGEVTHAARDWPKNFPSTTQLPPGAARIRSVSLDKTWEGWPPLTSEMKLTVRAIYEVKSSETAWQGKAI